MSLNSIKYCVVAFCFFLFSCGTDTLNENINPHAKSLNDEAMEQYSQIMYKPLHESETQLEDILAKLNEAIELDVNYALAYSNKANVLIKLQRYENAIEVLEEASKLKDDYAEVISLQGFYYEKIGESKLANEKYQEALKAYNNRISSSGKLEDKASRAFILLFTHGKQSALKEINRLKDEYPEDQLVEGMKQTIDFFNRETYICNL